MRRPLMFLVLAAAFAGCASAPGGGPGRPADGLAVDRGRFVALRSCAGCHAVGARGDSPDASAPPFSTLRLRYNELSLERRLPELSRNGHNEMPPIYMTPDEIADLVAYIQTVEADPAGKAAELPGARRATLSSARVFPSAIDRRQSANRSGA